MNRNDLVSREKRQMWDIPQADILKWFVSPEYSHRHRYTFSVEVDIQRTARQVCELNYSCRVSEVMWDIPQTAPTFEEVCIVCSTATTTFGI